MVEREIERKKHDPGVSIIRLRKEVRVVNYLERIAKEGH
jgi:hypothetical protein